jgi:hypothetical protein
MINILFIIFFHLVDYVEDIVECFQEKYFCSIMPYVKLKNDGENIWELLTSTIKNDKITHVFWFFLPEDDSIKDLKHTHPEIKHIYYNFDDPIGFNKYLFDKAQHIDYFINPLEENKLKYSIMWQKPVYVVEKYGHQDLVHSIKKEIECDVILLVHGYTEHDSLEKRELHRRMNELIDYCIEHDLSMELYGDLELEDSYPDIYCDEIDDTSELAIYRRTDLVIQLDCRLAYNKRNLNRNNQLALSQTVTGFSINDIKEKPKQKMDGITLFQWRDKIVDLLNEDSSRKNNIHSE